MSDFLVKSKKRAMFSIAFEKLDFNVHAVSACICKQYQDRRKKNDHFPQNLKVFTDFCLIY